MIVETYEIEQNTGSRKEDLDQEQIELIKKLGLEGQEKLISESEDGTQEVCPYRKMTADEQFAYRMMCPKITKAVNYQDGPIPLRVLQVLSHAKELDIGEIFVWSADSAVEPDPILVAGEGSKAYLLARWGEELDELPILLNKALKRFVENGKAHLLDKLEELKQKISKVEAMETVTQAMKEFKYCLSSYDNDIRYDNIGRGW